MKSKENIKTLLKNAQKIKVEMVDDFKLPAGWEDLEMEFVPGEPRENGGFKYTIDKDEGLKTILLKNGEIKHRTIKVKLANKQQEDIKENEQEMEL